MDALSYIFLRKHFYILNQKVSNALELKVRVDVYSHLEFSAFSAIFSKEEDRSHEKHGKRTRNQETQTKNTILTGLVHRRVLKLNNSAT